MKQKKKHRKPQKKIIGLLPLTKPLDILIPTLELHESLSAINKILYIPMFFTHGIMAALELDRGRNKVSRAESGGVVWLVSLGLF